MHRLKAAANLLLLAARISIAMAANLKRHPHPTSKNDVQLKCLSVRSG
jgi:hypothetical protein